MLTKRLKIHHHLTLSAVVGICQEKLDRIFVPDEQIEKSIRNIPEGHWGVFVYGPGTGPDFTIVEPERFDKWFVKFLGRPELTFWGVISMRPDFYGVVYPDPIT